MARLYRGYRKVTFPKRQVSFKRKFPKMRPMQVYGLGGYVGRVASDIAQRVAAAAVPAAFRGGYVPAGMSYAPPAGNGWPVSAPRPALPRAPARQTRQSLKRKRSGIYQRLRSNETVKRVVRAAAREGFKAVARSIARRWSSSALVPQPTRSSPRFQNPQIRLPGYGDRRAPYRASSGAIIDEA